MKGRIIYTDIHDHYTGALLHVAPVLERNELYVCANPIATCTKERVHLLKFFTPSYGLVFNLKKNEVKEVNAFLEMQRGNPFNRFLKKIAYMIRYHDNYVNAEIGHKLRDLGLLEKIKELLSLNEISFNESEIKKELCEEAFKKFSI